MTLKKVFQYKYLVLISALCLSAIGAYFSVYGIGLLFSAKFMEVSILGIVLESCKVATVGLLSLYWAVLSRKIKLYLITSVMILSVVTSIGIYSYLSSAYQENSDKIEVVDKQKEILNNKKQYFLENIVQLKSQLTLKADRLKTLSGLRKNQEKRLDEGTVNIKYMTQSNIKSSDKQIISLQADVDSLNNKIFILSDSVSKYEIKSIDLEKAKIISNDVGTLKYLSKLTGISMNKIVNILILLLMMVCDPFALALISTVNNKSLKYNNEENKDMKKQKELKGNKFSFNNFKKIFKKKSVGKKNDNIDDAILYEEVPLQKKYVINELPTEKFLATFYTDEEDVIKENIVASDGDFEDEVITQPIEEYVGNIQYNVKKQSLYLQLLEIFYDNGNKTHGDIIPVYADFKEMINNKFPHVDERDIKDFLLICNLFKITEFKENFGHFEKSYHAAINLISEI